MTRRVNKIKALVMLAFLLLALAPSVLPTPASADLVRTARNPYRGSWIYKGIIYGEAWNAADVEYDWMEVHATLYRNGVPWVTGVIGGEHIDFIKQTTRAPSTWGTYNDWQTISFHEWDIDGSSYGSKQEESDIVHI